MTTAYLPHSTCYLGDPFLIVRIVAWHSLIALSYFSIPAGLMTAAVRRRARSLPVWPLYIFSAFIFLCGLSHVMEIVVIWWPIYNVQAAELLLTAIASLMTVLIMLRRKQYRQVIDSIVGFEEHLGRMEGVRRRLDD